MPIKRKTYPSQKELHNILEYYPDTGLFMWRPKIGDTKPILMWNAQWAGKLSVGHSDTHGHLYLVIKKKKYAAHRLAWIYVHGDNLPNEIDHINRVRSDNRISNLREATRSQNNINGKGWSKIGLPKGIERLPGGNYRPTVVKDGVKYRMGCFKNLQEAQDAYLQKAKELFGEFASGG